MSIQRRKRGVKPNGKLIEKHRMLKGWSLQDLADEKPKVAKSTIERAIKGKPIENESLHRIAEKFGVEYKTLLAEDESTGDGAGDEEVDVEVVIAGDMKDWSIERRIKMQIALNLIAEAGGRIKIMKEESGSIKLTARMTRKDAEKLQQALAEGRLAELGVVSVGAPKPVIPEEGRLNRWYAAAKQMRTSTVLSALSIGCSLSGFFPIEALQVYILGITFGLAGLAIRWRVALRLWLPAIGIAANIGAAVAWPYVIGLFQDADGYHIRADERVREGEIQFILDDNFPDDEEYHIRISEGHDAPDPKVFRVYDLTFRGRQSPALSIKSRRYNVYIYHDAHLAPVDDLRSYHGIYVWPSVYGTTQVHVRAKPDAKGFFERKRQELEAQKLRDQGLKK
ncbi:MAG: hypothetical protein K8U57_27350 [Planctomycetes bacterium]|nr:hypothetical protein [Planctomycetota bacterium]